MQTIVVIYAENRGFDHLYGTFPGANGYNNATPDEYTQRDRDGTVLPVLPPINGNGLTDPSDPTQIPTEETRNHPNQPYALDDPAATTSTSATSCTTWCIASTRTRCRSTAARTISSPHGATPAAK